MATPLRLLVTTVGDAEAARRLARAAVEQRLAACVQIGTIASVYRWQGTLHEEPEWRILFKTSEARAPALRKWILEQHPYALPALYTLVPDDAHAAFADWVLAETGAGPG
jgi:periplasmic divalent cation tolerance protein